MSVYVYLYALFALFSGFGQSMVDTLRLHKNPTWTCEKELPFFRTQQSWKYNKITSNKLPKFIYTPLGVYICTFVMT